MRLVSMQAAARAVVSPMSDRPNTGAREPGLMDVADIRAEYDHPAWVTAVGTFIAYGIILVGMALLLFAVPWLIFTFI